MTTRLQTFDFDCAPSLDSRVGLIYEVQRGLLTRPRSLAPWVLYDEQGSRLFERITTLPEYYPTRTERDILGSFADSIVAAAYPGKTQPMRVFELGAGTASKTAILLEAAVHLRTEVHYLPVDISPDSLAVACDSIAWSLPAVRLQPIVVNYVTEPLQLEPFNGTTVVFYLGSSIANFTPGDARTILRNLGAQMQPGDALVLGTDMVKAESTLVAAYDDSTGITAAFNLNILYRLNRQLGANFEPAFFRHRALWNPGDSRIEMHIESTRQQSVRIPAAQVELRFSKHETIHTENSYKFTDEGIRILLGDSGFDVAHTWKDSKHWCAVTLARPSKFKGWNGTHSKC